MNPRIPTAIVLVALICIGPAAESGATTYDLLIRGARVLDGTGNPWFAADVAVEGGRIAALGQLDGARARQVIEAKDLYLAPGFIDIHSHANDGNATVVVNQDGRSP